MDLLLAWIPPMDTETPLKIRGWNVAGYSTTCSTSSNTNTIWQYKIICNGLTLFLFQCWWVFFSYDIEFSQHRAVFFDLVRLCVRVCFLFTFKHFILQHFNFDITAARYSTFSTVSYDWRSCNPKKIRINLNIYIKLLYIRLIQSQVASMTIIILKLDCLKSYTENIIVWTFLRILLPPQPNIPAPQCGRNYYRQRSYPWLSSLREIHSAGFQLRWQVIRAEILEIFHKIRGSTVFTKFHIISPST